MSVDNANIQLPENTLITNCDETFFAQVESDLYELMLYRFIDKYFFNTSKWLKPINIFEGFVFKYFSIIRVLVLIVCFLSVFVSLFGWLFLEPKIEFGFFTIFFMAVSTFFLCVRDIKDFKQKYVSSKFYRLYEKMITYRVNRTLKKGRQFLPYKAHYQCTGKTITAYRIKDNEKILAFSKTLEDFAIVYNHTTLFYKNNDGMFEKTLVMHNDKDDILFILQQLDIEYKVFSDKQLKSLLLKQKELLLGSD